MEYTRKELSLSLSTSGVSGIKVRIVLWWSRAMVVRIYGWVFVGVTGSGMKEKNLVIKVTFHKGDSYQ